MQLSLRPAKGKRQDRPCTPSHMTAIASLRRIIRHAIWLYFRFTLSYRDVEELLAERGLDISYETVRRWVLKFGPAKLAPFGGAWKEAYPLSGMIKKARGKVH
jgi:hypothetical protein